MSIVRICDCPSCHGYEAQGIMDLDDDYEVFGGHDICRRCLTGEWGCTYWQVRVLPELTALDRQIQSIYDPVIKAQLEAGAWLRDWDKYTDNRIKHITFKRERDDRIIES